MVEELEARVLSAVSTRLLSPHLVEEYVRTYHATRQEAAKANRMKEKELRSRPGELERGINRRSDMLLAGTMPASFAAMVIET